MSRLMRRLRRTLGWDRNPLRRRVDRVEAAIFAALFVIFPVVAPVISTMAGRAAAADAATWQHAEQSWRQVSAVIEHRPVIPAGELDGMFLGAEVVARWTAPPTDTALVNELRILAEVAAPAVHALVLYTTGRAVRLLLDQRRLAGWEKAWQAAGPQWSRRRR